MKPLKAFIFDIKRFAVHDGPGIRITVFFKGCPLSCWWCHNPEGIRKHPESFEKKTKVGESVITDTIEIGRWISVEELMEEIEKEKIFMDESGGGVTFSGGEPFMQHEYLYEAVRECKRKNIHTCIDTCGYVPPDILKKTAVLTDLILYDLKLINDSDHQKFTGVSNRLILHNLELLISLSVSLVVRIPVIPGINDSESQMTPIIKYLQSLGKIKRLDILPFHHLAFEKYRKFHMGNKMHHIRSYDNDQVNKLKMMFEKAGFEVKIGG